MKKHHGDTRFTENAAKIAFEVFRVLCVPVADSLFLVLSLSGTGKGVIRYVDRLYPGSYAQSAL